MYLSPLFIALVVWAGSAKGLVDSFTTSETESFQLSGNTFYSSECWNLTGVGRRGVKFGVCSKANQMEALYQYDPCAVTGDSYPPTMNWAVVHHPVGLTRESVSVHSVRTSSDIVAECGDGKSVLPADPVENYLPNSGRWYRFFDFAFPANCTYYKMSAIFTFYFDPAYIRDADAVKIAGGSFGCVPAGGKFPVNAQKTTPDPSTGAHRVQVTFTKDFLLETGGGRYFVFIDPSIALGNVHVRTFWWESALNIVTA